MLDGEKFKLEGRPLPANREECAVLARRIVAELGLISKHIDAAITYCERTYGKE